MLAIVIKLVMLLSLLEPTLDVSKKFVTGAKGGIHSHIARITIFIGADRGRLTAINNVKRRVFKAGMK